MPESNIPPDIRVPTVMLRDPSGFGGKRDGDCLIGQPVIKQGKLVSLTTASHAQPAKMVIPKLTEVHCHFDKCHTLHRMGTVGGDLLEAIETQRRDKVHWTPQDLRTRAAKGCDEAKSAGCELVRSHIDWGEDAEAPLSWRVLTEMDAPGVQWAALTSVVQMADADFAARVARQVAASHGVLGAFLLHHPKEQIHAALHNIFAQGAHHGLMLDFHVDEGLGAFDGVEAIADMALDTAYPHPILCGHAVALMDKSPGDLARIAEKLARANITICALPTTNLYLQGRTDATPDRRGLTRLRELHQAGVAITVGSDNVADAFCPVGQHNPMAALHLAVLAAHLDPPLERWLPMITTDARRALGAPPVFVEGAPLEDLLISDATDTASLISGRAPLVPAIQSLKGPVL